MSVLKKRQRTEDGENKEGINFVVDSNSPTTVDNWINGKFVPPVNGEYMDVHEPSTGKVLGRVAISSKDDVAAAVAGAAEAFKDWGSRTSKARVQVMIRFHELIEKHKEELAHIINAEHGKNLAEAIGEIDKGNETVEYAISIPQLVQGKILPVSRGVKCEDQRRPLGVVVSIVPFNFPCMVPLWTLPIAIATGNCFILKPSEKVPLTMSKVVQLLKEAGLPDGVVQIVNGTRDAVEALIDHPTVQGVTFVGSTPVAEAVSKRARALNKRVLALGGAKNHLVTLNDCNIEMASQDVVNSFTGCTGQRCMAASVLLTVGEQKEMVQQIVNKAGKLLPGKNAREIGPVIDKASLDKIHKYITQSEKLYAGKILLDGRTWTKKHPDGYWVGPTVILHTNPRDPALHDEIFGPVLSIFEVPNKEEAIKFENANPFGNAACIYTSVGENADWFTERFSAGMLGVNVGVPVPREPFSFGGINASKFGDMDITGDGGIEFFTRRIKITTKWIPPAQRSWMD